MTDPSNRGIHIAFAFFNLLQVQILTCILLYTVVPAIILWLLNTEFAFCH